MDILITGHGFIGRFLAHAFAAKGYNVSVLSRQLREPMPRSPIVTVQHDIRYPLPAIKRMSDTLMVIHTASVHPNSGPGIAQADYIDVNVSGALNVCEWAKSQSCKVLVNLSSISAYGAPKTSLLTEDSPLYSPGLYGSSKYLAEQMCDGYSKYFPSFSLRLPGVVGPGCHPAWVAQVVVKARSGLPIELHNPETPFNNIIHVQELARLIHHLFTQRSLFSGPVNVAAHSPITVREVVHTVIRLFKSPSPVIECERCAPAFTISIQRLQEKLEFQPRSTLENLKMFLSDFSVP
jgi:nucleoside-diphosphate-sugar epimerase